MPRSRDILVLLLVGLLGVVFFRLISHSVEPSYNGKRLSDWVLDYEEVTSQGRSSEVDAAVRQIGTNALPYLLKWIRYEPPAWKRKLSVTLKGVSDWSGSAIDDLSSEKEFRANGAVLAFKALGPEARGVIPDLARMVNDPKFGHGPRRALSTLGFLGTDALPALLLALTNQQPMVRFFALSAVRDLQTNARPAVPLLIQLLGDPGQPIADRAARILGELKLEPALAVPALISSLQDSRASVRECAAEALRAYAEDTRPAVPMLLTPTIDPDLPVRRNATNALLMIAPEALTNVPAPISP